MEKSKMSPNTTPVVLMGKVLWEKGGVNREKQVPGGNSKNSILDQKDDMLNNEEKSRCGGGPHKGGW